METETEMAMSLGSLPKLIVLNIPGQISQSPSTLGGFRLSLAGNTSRKNLTGLPQGPGSWSTGPRALGLEGWVVRARIGSSERQLGRQSENYRSDVPTIIALTCYLFSV